MSEMYRTEVPQYGTLLELVADVNAEVLAADTALKPLLERRGELGRLDLEYHGAIRLGTARELFTIRRVFAVMGMHAVGYYDLSVAGVPVHSTAFRPVDDAALKRNPFRVFTSLLRLELIEDQDLRAEAAAILAARDIFTARALELVEAAEQQGGLTPAQAAEFVKEALETFRWHRQATVSSATYRRLHDAHRLIADVVSFKGPHINHLTPRTLDIDAVQAGMPLRGIAPKAVIEGPPRRACPILLRQTSFKALEESVAFSDQPAGHPGG
ncbi:MAG TPA: VOC family protein, partial [Janthinobacterium sp.]|nr:VOC family protein [Janthinobacterium sp.]